MSNFKHGMKSSGKTTGTYAAWSEARCRCRNPKQKDYRHYGGRGITFCSRWDVFLNFLGDMGERPPNLTLERINVNGNYCPENCRWDTPTAQSRNQTSTRLTLEKAEKIRRLYRQWGMMQHTIAKHFGVSKSAVGRIVRGEMWKT